MLNRLHSALGSGSGMAVALAALTVPAVAFSAPKAIINTHTVTLAAFAFVVILAGVVPLNIWYYRHRARMTLDERVAEDASPELERLPGGWR